MLPGDQLAAPPATTEKEPPPLGTMSTLAPRLGWYRRRLKVMPPSEIAHRVAQQVGLCWFKVSHGLSDATDERAHAGEVSRYAFCLSASRRLPELPWAGRIDHKTRAHLLDGGLESLESSWRWRPKPDVWHLAPDTDRCWPRKFSPLIPYRVGNPYGDVRLAWEPSRLQQLVGLALLAGQSQPPDSARAVVLIEAQLRSWMDANPLLQGIHYISAMECALRILAVSHALDMVRRSLTDPRRTWATYVRMVHEHAEFIVRKVSRHSSSGNHTIAEAVGLLYAGCLLPELARAREWKSQGLALLQDQAPRQILADGGGAEQAFAYLAFIADLIGLAVRLLEQTGEPPSAILHEAFARAKGFLQLVGSGPDCLPPIGDADGGFALSRALRLSGTEQDTSRREEMRATTVVLQEAGYSILRPSCGGRGLMILDHGPLGMAPCFGHGHADALSLLFRYGGTDVLVDPGTGTYTGDDIWRAYFRGTRAHNTVTVDNLDQAEQEGAFIWSKPYSCRLVRRRDLAGGGVVLLAVHTGYQERAGVVHWRAVVYQPPALWLVWDRLTGPGEHRLELNWHLGVDPYPDRDGYRLLISGATVGLRVEGGRSHVHRGELFPIHGWRSTRYSEREPISTLRTHVRTALPYEFLTTLWFEGYPVSVGGAKEIVDDVRQWTVDADSH